MESYSISVFKNGIRIGAALLGGNFSALYSFEKAILLINNYNKNLVNVDLPDMVLAHRFLAGEVPSPPAYRSGLVNYSTFLDSIEYAEKEYPLYSWPDGGILRDNAVKIALIEPDIQKCNWQSEHFLDINLDNNTVELYGMFKREHKVLYCSKKGINYDEFDNLNLPTLDLDLSMVSFNELTDYYTLIKENMNGFLTPKSDLVTRPI